MSIPKPKSKQEEDELVAKFLSGLQKLFTKENNWTFLQPLVLSMDHCADLSHLLRGLPHLRGQRQEPDLPAHLSLRGLPPPVQEVRQVQRRDAPGLARRRNRAQLDHRGPAGGNSPIVATCAAAAQTCPIGVDNGLIAHEIRKLFSQEMGIAPKEIHDNGSVLHLKVGSSTGMNTAVVKDNMEFIDEDVSEKTGM